MPTMRGVAEGAEVGVMRGNDIYLAACANQAVKLLHGADHVGNVLDHMNGLEGVEGRIAKRVRKPVELAQHVGAAGRVAVYADRALSLVDPATDVKHPHPNFRLYVMPLTSHAFSRPPRGHSELRQDA